MKIRLASPILQEDSIVDGEGIRCVLWTQGCPHNCLGCHNPKTHSLSGGLLSDTDAIIKQLDSLKGQTGITFSGGDPMIQPKACTIIAEYAKAKKLNVWCYTGYTFEELLEKSKNNPEIYEFLTNIDVLVDGKFILSEKSYDCMFRGSKNQRLVDVPKSLETNKTVLVTKFDEKSYNNKGRKSQYMFV